MGAIFSSPPSSPERLELKWWKDTATVFAHVCSCGQDGMTRNEMMWVIQRSLKELGKGVLVWRRAMRGREQDLYTVCWFICMCARVCVCVKERGRERVCLSCHVCVRTGTYLQPGGRAALKSSVPPLSHHAPSTCIFWTNHMSTPVLTPLPFVSLLSCKVSPSLAHPLALSEKNNSCRKSYFSNFFLYDLIALVGHLQRA